MILSGACRRVFPAKAVFLSIVALVAVSPVRAEMPRRSELALTIGRIDRARIERLAEEALKLTPTAITQSHAVNSAGGPHDFFSQGDYLWPNSNSPNGLPYVVRDGESNPQNFEEHRIAMRTMKDAVAALAAAYTLTADDRYARKAGELVRVFFVDEKTRMNPNLDYAQAVLGQSTGNFFGIIDTLHLAELAVAVPFLERSHEFDRNVDAGLKEWLGAYLRWMTTSSKGVTERKMPNNHSVAYLLQIAAFSRCIGNGDILASAREQFRAALASQMDSDGSFPRELQRTKPYGYSIFQADNVAALCMLLSTPQDNLWQIRLTNGGTPMRAVEFIYPYLADKTKWLADGRSKDITHWEDWPARQPCLLFAYAENGDARYFDLWKRLNADPTDLEIRRNIAVTQPLLWIARPENIPLSKTALSRQEPR